MLLLSTFLFAFAVLEANSKYAVPFASIPKKNRYDGSTFIYVNASVGTPPQQVKLIIRTYLNYHGASPKLSGKDQCKEGSFDPYESSTYVDKDDNGATGTDTFSLIDGYVHTNLPLNVVGERCWLSETSLSLSYKTSIPSFIPDYARQQPNQVAILAFAQVGDNNSQETSGTLIIGDTASDLCDSGWQYLPFVETSDGSLGTELKIDRIKVGSFEKVLSTSVYFKLDNYNFVTLDSVYPQIEKILGIDNQSRISCNTQTAIELGFNGNTWKFGPHTYMDLSTKDSNGKCTSTLGYVSNDDFTLPFSFLKNNCIMYDYKNRRIGVAASKIAV